MKKKEKKVKTLVVNLFAGPGAGKSTSMAYIFAKLKSAGFNCEMAPEFAKEKVWENSLDVLNNQIYVFGKQHHTIHRLLGKVDIIITDSPLLLSIHYGSKCSKAFKLLVLEEHQKLNNINYFIVRSKKYNPKGRLQTEEQSIEIDSKIKNIISENDGIYKNVIASELFLTELTYEIIKKFKEINK